MPAFFPFEARFPNDFGDACESLIQKVQSPLNPHKGSDPMAAEAANQEALQAFQQMLAEGIWSQKPEQPLLVGYQCQFRGHTQRGSAQPSSPMKTYVKTEHSTYNDGKTCCIAIGLQCIYHTDSTPT